MKVIDLSQLIYPEMPVYSKAESPSFQIVSSLKNGGYRLTNYNIYSHTGTHIDFPIHMLNSNSNSDNIPVDYFLGNATIVDYSKSKTKNNHISIEDLSPYQKKIEKVDFIIIKTGWSYFWGEDSYYNDYPCLNSNAAEWLTSFDLKGIGIDAISIDRADSNNYPIHKKLLSKNILIIENLTNLDAITNEFFILSVLPLKLKNADGSPVRAVAIENIY